MTMLPVPVDTLSESTRSYLGASVAPATRRAYLSDWKSFTDWAEKTSGRVELPAPPVLVAEYLSAMAEGGYKASTISRHLAAITAYHRAMDLEPPTRSEGVRRVMRGIRRTLGTEPARKAEVGSADLAAYLSGLNGDLRSCRNRALLLWGLALAARRSELVGLQVEDLEAMPEGYRVTIRRSKTDQEGRGMVKAVVYGQHPVTCPVQAMREWLSRSGISSGPVFRSVSRTGRLGQAALSDWSVAAVVKEAAEAIGRDPASVAGHSLRRGFITEAARAGASERSIMNQTGHRSVPVLRSYITRATVFEDNAVRTLGL